MELALFENEEDYTRVSKYLYNHCHQHGLEMSWLYWTGLKSDGSQIFYQRKNQTLNAKFTTSTYQHLKGQLKNHLGGLVYTANGYLQSELQHDYEDNIFYFLCEEAQETGHEGMTKNVRLGYDYYYCMITDCFEHQIDYFGNDMTFITTSSPQQCQIQCQSVSNCRAWTFNGRSNSCYLKTSNSGKKPAESGITKKYKIRILQWNFQCTVVSEF